MTLMAIMSNIAVMAVLAVLASLAVMSVKTRHANNCVSWYPDYQKIIELADNFCPTQPKPQVNCG